MEYVKCTATLLKNFRTDIVYDFISGFSNYNEIQNRILPHFKLEAWTLITILCVFQNKNYKENPKVYSILDVIFSELFKSCYYLSLMFSKATKYNCLQIDPTLINDFNRKAQKLGFETGIPLIKTLKINNDEAYRNIKMILEVVRPSILSLFESSLKEQNSNFEEFWRALVYSQPNDISQEIKDLL